MANFRSCAEFDCSNLKFILVVFNLWIVFLIYAIWFVFLEAPTISLIWFVLTIIFFLLSFWSYMASVLVEPGSVPVFWALYSQERDERKYCLICHNFKPERSHHCSKCRKCVLNMDHHCPWINNCVGFDNRKYFLLFIFYLLLALKLALIQMAIVLVKEIVQIVQSNREVTVHTVIRLIQFFLCLVLLIVLLMFFYMHIEMTLHNTTTLQNMIRSRRQKDKEQGKPVKEEELHNPYDINKWYNFTQVFGENIFYWFIPLEEEDRLRGKGYHWEKTSQEEKSGRIKYNTFN